MTIPELNERAAVLCKFETYRIGPDCVWVNKPTPNGVACWRKWSPATDHADCAVVMDEMEKQGWWCELVGPRWSDHWWCEYTLGSASGTATQPNRWHAVTLAAVRAIEGESK